MKKLINLLKWFDDHLIHILVGIFIFLTPLVPKLPLHNVNYTYIAIRTEDLYMVGLIVIYGIQLLRKKVTINRQFLLPMALFWLAAFVSFIFGFYVMKTIEVGNVGFLNALRRVEYMSIFFIAASVIKSKKDFFYFLSLNCFVLFIVLFYAVGQKFIGWPAVQTMNPEYAKGYFLFLTPEARVSSTFAGHYDLAAYLVFLMPIVTGLYFFRKNLLYFGLVIFSIFVLVLTASRISYGAFVISLFPFLIFIRKPKHLIILIAITAVFTLSSNTLTSRFKRTFQVKQIFVNQNTGQVVVPQKISTSEVPAGSFYFGTSNAQNTDPNLLKANLLEDVRNASARKLSTAEAELLAASMEARLKAVNTIVSDISFSTRLQVEWPRAVKAFLRNPLLGTGPSSITEATDNDYLRSIGEFGLFGSLTFAFIFFLIVKNVFISLSKVTKEEKYIYLGFLFGLGGLLFNAGYIDVFEASKDAFFFWMMAGLIIGSLQLLAKKNKA